MFLLSDRSEVGPELDGDLCPVAAGGIAARALYLVDLQKPLDEGRRTLPGELLRSLTLELGPQTELRVFALTQDSAAPRRLLDRLCKPYGNADLAAEGAKDQGSAIRDCDNLPAQIPQHIRDGATKFCARRDALSERLDRLAERQSIEPVGNAYLIEALEETSLEFAELPPGPRSLHIFSDMMQHAHWYSHAELGWNGWSFNPGFLERRQAQDEFVGPRPPAIADAAVTLYYTPRQGVTSLPRAKAVHKNFWRGYFTDAAGTEPRFDEQPTMAAYQSAPLMDQQAEVAEAEQTEQEREQLRQEEMQQQLAEMERQQAEMEQARQQAEAEEQERQARMAELRQEREQLAQEEAERQRAEAAAAEAEAAAAEAEAAIAEAEAQAETAEQEEAAPPEPAIAQTPPEEEPEPPAIAQTEPEPPAEPPAPQEAPAVPPEEAAEEAATPAVAEAEPEPPAEEPPLEAPPAVADEPPAVAASPPPPCGLSLKSPFTNAGDIYPGGHRVDYGAATIVARYVVNEQGETEDDQILIDAERSVVGRARNFDLFADEVRSLIGRWEFDFMQPEDGSACTRGQSLSSQFQFQFNRRR